MRNLKNHFLLVTALVLLFGGFAALEASAQSQDPGIPGPYTVTRAEYDFGDTAFAPSGFPGPVELRASVHRPNNAPGGALPVIVLLHGRHVTCYSGAEATLEHPCPAGSAPIPNYVGYDYAARQLASHGYIVVSISANGINAQDANTADQGAQARAELIQKHLDILKGFNTTGGAPFGTQLVGKLDLNRIGTMGHSRGGEGVVKHYQLNESLGSPYGVKAVLPLASVNFSRFVINNVPLAAMQPYCDGDVFDLPGVQFYDDARYNVPGDRAAKHSVLVMGANHNFFNTVWTPGEFPAGTFDDWDGVASVVPAAALDSQCSVPFGNRLTPAQQRAVLQAYMAGFFRAYVGGELQFLAIMKGDAPAPASAATDELHVSYHAPDTPNERLDVNRLLGASNLTVNTVGGAVAQSGLLPYDLCGGDEPQPRHCLERSFGLVAAFGAAPNEPHTTPSFFAPEKRGLSQLRFGWANALGTTAEYRNNLPPGRRNVVRYRTLQFRVGVNFEDVRNEQGLPQDFTVVLTDGFGRSTSVNVGDYSRALYYPPGSEATLAVPRVVLNTVRIPLNAFGGINFTDVRSIRFRFDRKAAGGLLVSDLAFASDLYSAF